MALGPKIWKPILLGMACVPVKGKRIEFRPQSVFEVAPFIG
jgi:hypothetical protein